MQWQSDGNFKRISPWVMVAALCLASAAIAQELRYIPHRIDPQRRPVPHRNTRMLWNFEKGDARDSTHFGNDGEMHGRVRKLEDGRFGAAIILPGGRSGLRLDDIRGLNMRRPAAIDFWFKPDGYPETTVCLLEMDSSNEQPAVRLDMLPDGRLRLDGTDVAAAVSDEPLEPDRWVHLAVQSVTLYRADRVFIKETALELLVNGFTAIRTFSETQRRTGPSTRARYIFPPHGALPALSVGNRLTMDAGVRGVIDEFRITTNPGGFYKMHRQPFLNPDADSSTIARSTDHFQAPERLVFCADFSEPDILQRIRQPGDPVRIETGGRMEDAPPAAPGDMVRAGLELDDLTAMLGDELLDELTDSEKPEELRFIPLRLKPGVRGNALVVRGGAAHLDVPEGLDLLDGGTIEFWFKPGDWDNLNSPPPLNATWSYRRSLQHVLTLWGIPSEGGGAAERLLSFSLSRLQGAQPVSPALFDGHSPELADHFVLPRTPITPRLWRHVLLVWGSELRHLQPHAEIDGNALPYLQRSRFTFLADKKVWERCTPSYITLGNELETAFDELRIYDYPFTRDGPERANARATFTGEVKEPLGGAIVRGSYRMSLGDLVLNVSPLHRYRGLAASAELTLHVPDGEKTARIDDFPGGTGTVTLDVGLLPEGVFPITGRFLDAGGDEVSAFEHKFIRNPVPWHDNRIGHSDTPPPPFEPVTRDGAVVGAVGREYHIGTDGNFEQIYVLGEPILAEPIRFVTGSEGIKLEGVGQVGFGETGANETTWRAQASGDGIEISSRVLFEYDGMAKYTLDVRPKDGPVTVDRLSLEIHLQQEYGWLIHALPFDGNFRHYQFYGTGTLRGRTGEVWNSKTFTDGSAGKPTYGNFVPSVWLGGVVRGLYWFADNDAGWVPSEEHPAVTVNWEGDVITMSLNFISEPFVLREPRRIVYALMGTPPKPLPENHRAWNRGDYENYPLLAGRLTSCEAFAPWAMPVKSGCFDYWPIANDWGYAESASSRQRSSRDGKYPDGVNLMLYHDKRFVPIGPDTEYFAWGWHQRGQAAWPQSKVDCLIWHMDQWFGRDIMDGIYIDDIFPVADWNHETGSAYKLPDGRVQPGSANFIYREYLKRLYNVLIAHGKPPVITLHATHTLPPFMSFATVNFDGEDGGGWRADGSSSFIDVWRLDRLMALNISERTGLVTAFMLGADYYLQGRARDSWRHMVYRVLRSKNAVDLLFDFNHHVRDWRKERQKPGVELLPFWRNENAVRVTAHRDKWDEVGMPETDLLHELGMWDRQSYRRMLQTHPLRATLYLKENRCLVIVANLDGEEELIGTVELDMDLLGIPPEYRQTIIIEDVDDGAVPPEGIDLQRLERPDAGDIDMGHAMDAFDFVESITEEMVEDIRRDPDQESPPLKLENGMFMLSVPPHDFRAVELRWQNSE